MRRLTVVYDPGCGLCREARDWLARQPRFVDLEFVEAASALLRLRYPGVDPEETLRQLTVIGDDRAVYRDAKAWVMCLWALRDHRALALRLARPHLLPTAERVFRFVSRNRRRISRFAPLVGAASSG